MSNPRGRILIVDDDPAFCALFTQLLGAAGHRVHCVSTGQAALDELQKGRTDLVLLEAKLPDMEGAEVCMRIRCGARDQMLPIIALTSNADARCRVAMKGAGVDDLLAKPVHWDELGARVRQLLSMRAHYAMYDQRRIEAELECTRWRVISDVATTVAVCQNFHELTESLGYVFRSEIEADAVGYVELREQGLELAGSSGGTFWPDLVARVRAAAPSSDTHVLEMKTEAGHDVVGLPIRSGGALRGYLCVARREAITLDVRRLLTDVTSHLGNAIANVRNHHDAQELEVSRRNIGRLLAQDLSYPAQLLRLNIGALAETHPGAEVADSAAAIQQIESLMQDLVDISRAEDGMLSYDPEATHVRKLMNASLDALAHIAQRSAVRIEAHVDPNLAALLDRSLMQRVIENVVLNAIRHARAGGKIEIRATRDAGELVIEVANDGRAIAPEVREQFYRQFGATSQYANLGVGLYFSKVAVAQHGGRIEVTDRKGGGARFMIYVPLDPTVSSISDPHGAVTMRVPTNQRTN